MSEHAKFTCPICSSSLEKEGQTLRCSNNHAFDYAKEGYVNLLPVQLKKSLQPGDDLNMVVARREFLQLGHYEFMRSKLIELIAELSPNTVVDLGCGEGYYTSEVKKQMDDKAVYGFDISKSAVKYAAKRNKQVHYAVATNAHVPLATDSVDLVMNVFAPLIGKECQRILVEQGKILSVSPGPHHLFEIKQVIYPTADLHETPKAPDMFELEKHDSVSMETQITEESDLSNLLTMTPFGWKTSEENLTTLKAKIPFVVTLDFVISTFKQLPVTN
ncbi:putative RNA methyltransferase [Psychrosphaera haliotis]|uniref:Methyltransferase domain-containing protein n=1 Tax=Psychrosphaera haliotis TaxID=555083 RepID=A0A6N8FB58_9GAMM|nr:methyltransferase domain-containing protein [Psychrosphaera haliotis]MUH71621.1 methyltransferase domain-containing protein [Psychrosphaera haliotis]